MAICIITDAFNDQGTRKILPHASALHFKCNDTVSSSNVISVFSRFHHSVTGSNKPEMDEGVRRLNWPVAKHQLPFIAFELLAAHLNSLVAYVIFPIIVGTYRTFQRVVVLM